MFKQMLEVIQSEINDLTIIIKDHSKNCLEKNGSIEFSRLCDKRELLKVIHARMEEYESKYEQKEPIIQVNIKSLIGHLNIISTSGLINTDEVESQVKDALLRVYKLADQG